MGGSNIMCAISGFYSKREISTNELKIVNDTMYSRGPDDSGEIIIKADDGFNVGMAHRRLSILDLTFAGHQPMESFNSRYVIVYNGEIYNFNEIKKELYSEYPFKTKCDTEVILASFIKWGEKCVDHFNGMFAIALYDKETQVLYLIRDRIGKKPLYYMIDEYGLSFASELKAIKHFPGFTARINRNIISRYLLKGYINAPHTIYENVFKLDAGCILKYHLGNVDVAKYWDIIDKYHVAQITPPQEYNLAKEELKHILKQAVKRRLISDVPIGALLSGGFDSSLVCALAQECMGGNALRTFSVGFVDGKYDESGYARLVSEHLGTIHNELLCTENDMVKLVDGISGTYDEPFADASAIPTMLVSQFARRDVTVALSGDGGDEFFCGYNIYKKVKFAQRLDKFGAILHEIGTIANIEQHYPAAVQAITYNRDKNVQSQIYAKNYLDFVNASVLNNAESFNPRFDWEQDIGVNDWQIRRMLLDMETYLPDDILTKVDRASMKYSLECRCPMLDKEVMEYSFGINHDYKFDGSVGKKILREITYDYIPREIMDRPKMGFGIPLKKWLQHGFKEKLLEISDFQYIKDQGIFEPELFTSLVQNFLNDTDEKYVVGADMTSICWNFFVFQKWYEKETEN